MKPLKILFLKILMKTLFAKLNMFASDDQLIPDLKIKSISM